MNKNGIKNQLPETHILGRDPKTVYTAIRNLIEGYRSGKISMSATNILFALESNTYDIDHSSKDYKNKATLIEEIGQLITLEDKLTKVENLWADYLNGNRDLSINSIVSKVMSETQEINTMKNGQLYNRKKRLVGAISQYRMQQNTRKDIDILEL